MRFLSIYHAAETGTPPTGEEMAAMQALIEEMTSAGTLIATEGCLPSALGARVRRSGDELSVTDGPFTESKELVAGFALLEAESKEHAIELTRRFLQVAGDGECEIRALFQGDGCVPETALAEAAAA
ncbi:MAG: YciI family protein [Longimicrobiaceae bacterium]